MANGNLSGRVASGVAWSISEKAGSMLLQAVVSIVVANMLVPLDLGIMAVLTVFTALAQVVVDSGFSQTLIRKADPTDGDYKAVFRFNVITSIVLYALLTALSPVAARYYGWPELARVAPVLFLLLPVNALCVIQNTIMVREFRFAQLSAITFAASLASGIVAVVMAVSGCGVWSLVGQRVSMMAVKAALLWIRSPWRPRAACKASSLGEMAPYSLRLMGTDLITALYNNIAPLFIGKIYSGDALGCFNQAQKLKDMPVNSAMQSIQSVTFPALARIGGDETKFAESYRRVVMVTAFAMFPAMAGLIATADDIYALLLKPDWRPAVPYFRILCLTGIFYPLSTIAYNILKVRSDGGIILRLEFVKRAMTTIILIITIPRSVGARGVGRMRGDREHSRRAAVYLARNSSHGADIVAHIGPDVVYVCRCRRRGASHGALACGAAARDGDIVGRFDLHGRRILGPHGGFRRGANHSSGVDRENKTTHNIGASR